MIEKRENKLYLKCDICKKEIFWKDFTAFDVLRKSNLPEGWTGYKEFNVTKMIFCPEKVCQQALNIMLEKIGENNAAKESWM